MGGTAQADCSRDYPNGSPARFRQFGRERPMGHHSGGSIVIRNGGAPDQLARAVANRAGGPGVRAPLRGMAESRLPGAARTHGAPPLSAVSYRAQPLDRSNK